MPEPPPSDPKHFPSNAYATTRWSIVLSAAERPTSGRAEDPECAAALNELCQTYWLPLYAYARRRTTDPEEAKDFTQAFFQKLLEKNYLASANRERGRFRSFLITAFKNFLANEWDKTQAEKRGGKVKTLALDFIQGDSQLSLEPSSTLTPEQSYERQWAMTLLRNSLNQLREEYQAKGKLELFEQLKERIAGESNDTNYGQVAKALGTTEAAVKMTVHRMRDRYRSILRREISETVADASEIDEEIQRLFNLFENG